MAYYVYIPSEGIVYGPYSRGSALTFARIGSAHGKPRQVFREPGSVLVRRYVDGKATYREKENRMARRKRRRKNPILSADTLLLLGGAFLAYNYLTKKPDIPKAEPPVPLK